MAQVWSGVALDLQSALANTKTISAIALGATATVSCTTNGYSNGDYVLITCTSGMRQVNLRVFRVSAVATDNFVLEGENTTSYDAFVSGGAQKITFGTSMQIVTGLSSTGGEPEEIDQTTIHQRERSILYGASTPSQFALELHWGPADAGFVALKAASDARTSLAVRFTWPNAYKHLFYGLVFASGDPTGNAQGLVTSPARITRTGSSTFYAT